MKKLKTWKRFIALLVVLALVIQCNFNAIAVDSNEEKQQQTGAVVEEMMAEETATEGKDRRAKARDCGGEERRATRETGDGRKD